MVRVSLLVAIVLTAGLLVGLGACSKEQGPTQEARRAPTATLSTGTVGSDGVRTVPIEAGMEGYVPDKIPGKPGERLNLVFTRTVEGECLRELKTPDGELIELPMNKATEIAVTVPADGEVRFACGMDMFFGVVVAEKS